MRSFEPTLPEPSTTTLCLLVRPEESRAKARSRAALIDGRFSAPPPRPSMVQLPPLPVTRTSGFAMLGHVSGSGSSSSSSSSAQVPPAQIPSQGWSQPPQCAELVWTSTHASEHSVSPSGHSLTHPPPTHSSPAAHARPHPPQCSRSAAVSTHAPEHSSKGAPQTQTPCWHSPAPQETTHAAPPPLPPPLPGMSPPPTSPPLPVWPP